MHIKKESFLLNAKLSHIKIYFSIIGRTCYKHIFSFLLSFLPPSIFPYLSFFPPVSINIDWVTTIWQALSTPIQSGDDVKANTAILSYPGLTGFWSTLGHSWSQPASGFLVRQGKVRPIYMDVGPGSKAFFRAAFIP